MDYSNVFGLSLSRERFRSILCFRVMCPSIVICAVVNHVGLARMTKVQEENWVAVTHYMGTIKKVVQLDFYGD